jgi:hypothetical protein
MDWLDTLIEALATLRDFSTVMDRFSTRERIFILLLLGGVIITISVCLIVPGLLN